jgi:hypothetical protein
MQFFQGRFELESAQMHDQINPPTPAHFGMGVKELGARSKELKVPAIDI